MNKLEELLLNLGYSEDEYTKILNNHFLKTYVENTLYIRIKEHFDFLLSLGYSGEDIMKMTKTLPTIYGYSIENMKQKINDVISLGYSKDEVIKMTKVLPAIYGLSIENIKQKINFYNSINMHELAIVDAKLLMQSTALSYARYEFYKEKGIQIDMFNYKKLFIVQKRFEKQFGMTNQELLKKYDHNQKWEKKDNGRTV